MVERCTLLGALYALVSVGYFFRLQRKPVLTAKSKRFIMG